MNEYDKNINLVCQTLIKKDEDDRKSKKLQKFRSELEAIEYRDYFDNSYRKISEEFVNSALHDYGAFPSPNSKNSLYLQNIEMNKIHESLSRDLFLPQAISKVIDYKTHNGGKNTDIGKICNLYSIIGSLGQGLGLDKTKIEFAKAGINLIKWLTDNSIMEVFYNNRGFETQLFIYWLIYDNDNKKLDLNMLIEFSEASKGSFNDFKMYLVALWMLKRIDPFKTIDYRSLIKNTHC